MDDSTIIMYMIFSSIVIGSYGKIVSEKINEGNYSDNEKLLLLLALILIPGVPPF